MKTTHGINRRQWLRTAGLTLAGIFVAPRLARSAVEITPLPSASTSRAAELRAKPAQPREYVHGFEAYPTA